MDHCSRGGPNNTNHVVFSHKVTRKAQKNEDGKGLRSVLIVSTSRFLPVGIEILPCFQV